MVCRNLFFSFIMLFDRAWAKARRNQLLWGGAYAFCFSLVIPDLHSLFAKFDDTKHKHSTQIWVFFQGQ